MGNIDKIVIDGYEFISGGGSDKHNLISGFTIDIFNGTTFWLDKQSTWVDNQGTLFMDAEGNKYTGAEIKYQYSTNGGTTWNDLSSRYGPMTATTTIHLLVRSVVSATNVEVGCFRSVHGSTYDVSVDPIGDLLVEFAVYVSTSHYNYDVLLRYLEVEGIVGDITTDLPQWTSDLLIQPCYMYSYTTIESNSTLVRYVYWSAGVSDAYD